MRRIVCHAEFDPQKAMTVDRGDVVDPRLIRIAAEVLAETELNDPVDLPRKIQRAGVADWNLTCLLYQMIPLAMGRAMLDMTGMYLHDEFIFWNRATGESSMRLLREDPLFCQIQAELPNLFNDGDQRRLQNVLQRSPERDAVQQLRAAGGDITQVAVGAPLIALGLPHVGAAGFVFKKRTPENGPHARFQTDTYWPSTVRQYAQTASPSHRPPTRHSQIARRGFLAAIFCAAGLFFACSGAVITIWIKLFLRRRAQNRPRPTDAGPNRPLQSTPIFYRRLPKLTQKAKSTIMGDRVP